MVRTEKTLQLDPTCKQSRIVSLWTMDTNKNNYYRDWVDTNISEPYVTTCIANTSEAFLIFAMFVIYKEKIKRRPKYRSRSKFTEKAGRKIKNRNVRSQSCLDY